MKASYFNFANIDLSQFKEARAFGPEDHKLRGSVTSDFEGNVQVVDGKWLRITTPHILNRERILLGLDTHHRVEFTENPWPIRLAEGTRDILSFVIRFPKDYKRALSNWSAFQMYCRSDKVSKVLFQLEFNMPDHGGWDHGQLLLIHQTKTGKVILPLPFNPGPGEQLPVLIDVMHGVEGAINCNIGGLPVYSRVQTAFAEDPQATAQWKVGVYHHMLRIDKNGAHFTDRHLEAGITKQEIDYSPVTLMRFDPGESVPSTAYKMADPFREVDQITGLKDRIINVISGL